MQVLTPSVDLVSFLAKVAEAKHRLLMLDYDGTLAPFHVQPECAVPYPEVRSMLADIVNAGGTRVVIVSGRPVDEVPPLLALNEPPEIWGSHGWERLRADGTRVVQEPQAEVRSALAKAEGAIREVMPPGARLEHKLASLALHWRGLSQNVIDSVREKASAAWQPIARDSAVELLPFDGGLELRAQSCNKQYAVKTVLSETPEGSAVAYLGDDTTDEDAFRAIKARGIGVLVRPEFRQTQADVWLRPPGELLSFMRHWRVARESA
ncbi:MAG TPA: trehalose-phosphatase [Burkholderiales bacterium]|nr:trehalose-phosphatase [Burkholderiales bacterium]